eukprot:scaffold1388_cov390-Prasinococcus_capsulatus_cf.AAC.31
MSLVSAPQNLQENVVQKALKLGAAAAVGLACHRLLNQAQRDVRTKLEMEPKPTSAFKDSCLAPELADQLDMPTVCMRVDVARNADGSESVRLISATVALNMCAAS